MRLLCPSSSQKHIRAATLLEVLVSLVILILLVQSILSLSTTVTHRFKQRAMIADTMKFFLTWKITRTIDGSWAQGEEGHMAGTNLTWRLVPADDVISQNSFYEPEGWFYWQLLLPESSDANKGGFLIYLPPKEVSDELQ